MALQTIPSFFNYNRSIDPTEGFFFGAGDGETLHPVEVKRVGVRGAIGNYIADHVLGEADKAGEKAGHNIDEPNPQKVDIATLPQSADTLVIRYGLIFSANALKPSGCNDAEVAKEMTELVAAYGAKGGFKVLAERYAWNIANGRTFWRNAGAANRTVTVAVQHAPNPASFSYACDDFGTKVPSAGEIAKVKDLAVLIERALSQPRQELFLKIEMRGGLLPGAIVYPSEEFIGIGKGEKGEGKYLSSTPVRIRDASGQTVEKIDQATFHPQKIGNAIRTIDEWNPRVDEIGAIPAEVYGYVQSISTSVRARGERDGSFYALLHRRAKVKAAIDAAKSAKDLPGEAHYLVAVLVRGGVFSAASKEKPADKAAKGAKAASADEAA